LTSVTQFARRALDCGTFAVLTGSPEQHCCDVMLTDVLARLGLALFLLAAGGSSKARFGP